jgi:hypothetical protein
MDSRRFIVQIVLLLVAVIHCWNFVNSNLLDAEGFKTYSIEYSDLDTNQSDSEENEEEVKIVDYYSSKISSFSIKIVPVSVFKNLFSYFFREVQAPFLSIPYSPPEAKI